MARPNIATMCNEEKKATYRYQLALCFQFKDQPNHNMNGKFNKLIDFTHDRYFNSAIHNFPNTSREIKEKMLQSAILSFIQHYLHPIFDEYKRSQQSN